MATPNRMINSKSNESSCSLIAKKKNNNKKTLL